jgi:carbamoyl-phosphate synthase large subunit
MPKRNDIHSILIIGAGPIVIGQACEFDYSGTQATKALKAEGYRVILVNSNPATIMTDPELADATYIEPITPEMVEKIIEKERPDALLPTMGGQTALNCAKALAESGVLAKYGVELIGASLEAINKAENRDLFNQAMAKIGLEVAKNGIAHNLEEARAVLEQVGLPAIIRPSFTLGGSGGGIAYNREEFEQIVASGLDASPTTEVLIDESVLGWKEYEMEVVRDRADNCIIVCSIENVDPMGVHTGDSITVAPALTLTDKEYQRMRDASIAVLREIGVDTGGSNVQFAVNPENGRMVVIEMNPRVSRSSALASKATGFPIAKVAAKLAVGYTLDEIINDVTKATPASFEPSIDYVVTKIPRFTFEKFPGTDATLTTAMKSVGEAMAMGRNFAESLQKALRSLEVGLQGLDEVEIPGAVTPEGEVDRDAIRAALGMPTPQRLLHIAQALRFGFSQEEICEITKYDPWFVAQLRGIVQAELRLRAQPTLINDRGDLLEYKKLGFSDAQLAKLSGKRPTDIRTLRQKLGVLPVYKRVDTCAAEFEALTPYMYSTYEGDGLNPAECESQPSNRNKIIILGGGPNRIGQGIEFDYCCVHAAYALKDAGYETIMVNCNPETVSTDYDTSDRLYFEPLTIEDVLEIVRVEQASGYLQGLLIQYGGQTPLKLAHGLEEAGVPIIGTTPDSIDLAEDRERFQKLLFSLGLKQPQNSICHTAEDVVEQAERIGYPVVVRPSYVLGGRAMRIVHEPEALKAYLGEMMALFGDGPILMDSYLTDAIEVDVDALSDGQSVYVAGVMEHIEEAGIHSGDSACSLPPYSLPGEVIEEIRRQTVALAEALEVVGLMNVQFAVKDGEIYILEVNPRASRTVPFVAKATGYPLAKIAARLMAGEKLASFGLPSFESLSQSLRNHMAVKEVVFPFARFPGVDVILGPEMKSTGEAMGLDTDFARAFAKGFIATGGKTPMDGTVFISVKAADKPVALQLAQQLTDLGYQLMATRGTAQFLADNGLEVTAVNKVREGRPHNVDMMKDGKVHLVINTTEGAQSIADSYEIRRTALMNRIPYTTTIAGARALVQALGAMQEDGGLEVRALQEYFITKRKAA